MKLIAKMILFVAVVTLPAAAEIPARISDQEFWKLVSEFSEPDGTFHSENLVSHELRFQARNFCGNATALPIDTSSTFIRSARGGFARQVGGFRGQLGFGGPAFVVNLAPMKSELSRCVVAR